MAFTDQHQRAGNNQSPSLQLPDSYKDRVSVEQRQDRVTALEYASKIQPNDNFRQTAADILRFIETGSFAPPPLTGDMDVSWKAAAEWAPSPVAKPVE